MNKDACCQKTDQRDRSGFRARSCEWRPQKKRKAMPNVEHVIPTTRPSTPPPLWSNNANLVENPCIVATAPGSDVRALCTSPCRRQWSISPWQQGASQIKNPIAAQQQPIRDRPDRSFSTPTRVHNAMKRSPVGSIVCCGSWPCARTARPINQRRNQFGAELRERGEQRRDSKKCLRHVKF